VLVNNCTGGFISVLEQANKKNMLIINPDDFILLFILVINQFF